VDATARHAVAESNVSILIHGNAAHKPVMTIAGIVGTFLKKGPTAAALA
jgi:hypothetical protein